jgi:tRNA-specific 2-thiouridylase
VKTVFVGLSGGVDSSVAAALLRDAGYRVVGVYMKNWSKDIPGFECPWKEDYMDAKRVAVQLGIDFELIDFETQYHEKVVNYMIEEYKIGRTPNPDIMCNQEIKFKLFYDTALESGADYIATGHYAITKQGRLYAAKDKNKDQSYFLYRVNATALRKTLFPLGEYTKPEVRTLAESYNLVTAKKKESMGICFVGKVGIKEFLQQYVTTQPGPVIDQFGVTIGTHDGAIFYTIGQRHGLGVIGGLPVYVVGKDIDKNIVYVTSQLDDDRLWRTQLHITSQHWIDQPPRDDTTYLVRSRHRAPLVPAKYIPNQSQIELEVPIRAITPGQSVVMYDADYVVGGGIVV